MEPNLFGYMNYGQMMDPLRYMEMQAQYLRLLAQFLSDPDPSSVSAEPQSERGRMDRRELVSASVQVEMQERESARMHVPPAATEEVILSEPRSTARVSSEMPLPPILEVSPPVSRLPTEEAIPAARRRAKNFDEIPIAVANKGFEALLEEELRKDAAPTEAAEAKPHNFLKKSTRNKVKLGKPGGTLPVKTVETEESREESKEESKGQRKGRKNKPAVQKEFLKRKSGQLCVKKGQVTASPVAKKGRKKDREADDARADWPEESSSPDQPLGPPGADVIEKLRSQMESLSTEVSRLRKESASNTEETLNAAIEKAKNDRVRLIQDQMRAEIEAKKRLEATEWAKERRNIEKSTIKDVATESENLKIHIKQLQEEARSKEDAHRAAAESLKQQIDNLRKKAANGKGKSNTFAAKTSDSPISKPKRQSEAPKASKTDPVGATPDSLPARTESIPAPRKPEPPGKPEQARPPPSYIDLPKVESTKATAAKPPPPVSTLEAMPTFEVKVQSQTTAPDGKVQRIYTDGKKEVLFPNGVRKEVLPDGSTIVYFANKDVKTTYPDGKVVYHFAEAQTTQTTCPDKLQVFQFSNGQVEKHYPDGMKEIKFTDGTVKCIFPDGEEESIFPDGTVQKIDSQGVKFIDNVNGQKDTVYPDGTKVREFPDGTVKRFGADGKLLA